MGCGYCKRVDWVDIRNSLTHINPTLRSALDEFATSRKKAYVYHVRYPYGQLIVDNGLFTAPCSQDVCQDCRLLMDECEYSPIPLTLVLTNPVEVFIDYPKDTNGFRFAPLRVIKPGELFGVFEVLDLLIGCRVTKPTWSLSSGSRCVWILAPLGNSSLKKELSARIFETVRVSEDLMWEAEEQPHWQLIQECTRGAKHSWSTEVVVFPSELIRSLKKSTQMFSQLLSVGWQSSATLRHSSIEHPAIREGVARIMKRVTLPGGEMHHYSAMLHFLNVINGSLPAYRSSHTVETASGPFSLF